MPVTFFSACQIASVPGFSATNLAVSRAGFAGGRYGASQAARSAAGASTGPRGAASPSSETPSSSSVVSDAVPAP